MKKIEIFFFLQSPLSIACLKENEDMAKLLLSYGADAKDLSYTLRSRFAQGKFV